MGIFEKLFGTHSERELKRIYPIVDKIESMRDSMMALSDSELSGKTKEFKDRLANGETLDDILPEAFAESSFLKFTLAIMLSPFAWKSTKDALRPDANAVVKSIATQRTTARTLENVLMLSFPFKNFFRFICHGIVQDSRVILHEPRGIQNKSMAKVYGLLPGYAI